MIDKDYLKELLTERLVTVEFTKKDGTVREMLCTLNKDRIPNEFAPKGTTKTRSEEALSVFDIEANGWRSFRYDSIIGITYSIGENK